MQKLNNLKKTSFSRSQLAIFIVIFAALGGYLIYRSFAAAPLVTTLEAEQMSLPATATITQDATASSGKAMYLPTNATTTGSVNFPSSVTSLSLIAKGTQCSGAPTMNVSLDGSSLLSNQAVSSSSWTSYAATPTNTLNSGTHSLSISFSNDYTNPGHGKKGNGACSRALYVDVTSFFGPTTLPTPAPTVSLSATPTNVTAGQASTLNWNSTNATSCNASGSWSGATGLSGSTSTGAVNQTSTYNLTCTGDGGSGVASATVSVSAAGTTWTFCANENGQCSFSGAKDVRYGANGQYITKNFTDGTACNNAVFGDPAPGYLKECDYATTSTAGTGLNYPASYFTGPLGANELLPTKQGAFLIDQYGGPVTWDQQKTALLQRQTDMGRKYDGIQFHYDGSGVWPDGTGMYGMNDPHDYSPLPEQFIIDNGSFPVIAWTPNYTIGQMNSGAADAIWAKAANYWKGYAPNRIIIRSFAEFNLCTTYAAPACSLNGNVNYCGTPFITAWRRMVGVFKQNGATNVGFQYNPDEGNNRGCVNQSYPGDAYVDWVGSDTYNRSHVGDNNSYSTAYHPGWAEWWELFHYSGNNIYGAKNPWSMYDIFSSGAASTSDIGVPGLPTRKPFVIGETGSIYDSNYPTKKGDWFRNVVANPNGVKSMPNLQGISFYDSDVTSSEGADSNFRVDYPTTDPSVYAGYIQMAKDPWFNTR